MDVPDASDAASYFLVSDVPAATTPASRLRDILDKLAQHRPLTTIQFSFLRQQGFVAIERFARGEITYEAFREAAGAEQVQRQRVAEAERQAQHAAMLARAAEQEAREAAWAARQEAARRARESDPKYIAKQKNQALRTHYGLDEFIEQDCFAQLMDILRRIDGGNRLTDEDVVWLTTKGRMYYSDELQTAHHAREAQFCAGEYKRTGDPWNAVNASSHYRKCKQASNAHELLTSIPAARQKPPKLRSAIATTHGGVMRDLKRWDEALQFGNQAHALTPNDYRPCTLLGAVNFELGHYDLGRDWYEKATERGASERSIDHELRGILLRADQAKQDEITAFLLRDDPVRYGWVKKLHQRKPRAARK